MLESYLQFNNELLLFVNRQLTTGILNVSPAMRVDSQEETYGRLLNAF